MDFYQRVILLCQQKGVSRSKMADDIGISRSTPKDWKEKGSTPQLATVKKVADYFGVTTEYLMNDNASPETAFNTVHGNNNIIGNGNTVGSHLTEQEKALLELFGKLDVVKQAKLIAYAADLEK